jgi:hypothetical protein
VPVCVLTKGLLSLLLLAAATPAFAQRVQSGSNRCSWTQLCSVPFSSSVTAGDAVVVAVSVSTWETGPQTPVLADTQGNNFAIVTSLASTFLFCTPKVAAGPDSVSSSIAVAQVQAMIALEFQGTCTVDQAATASGSSASAATSGISAHAGDFLIAAATSSITNTFHPSAGFTAEQGPGTIDVADSPQSVAGTASATFTLGSSANWTALFVAFSPASANTATFNTTATLKWDDGTPVAGTVTISQQTSASPVTLNSLGSFPLNSSGVAQGAITISLSSPLTFLVTLVNTSGTVVNSMNLFANNQVIQTLPHTFNPSIVLSKSNGSVVSVSF